MLLRDLLPQKGLHIRLGDRVKDLRETIVIKPAEMALSQADSNVLEN